MYIRVVQVSRRPLNRVHSQLGSEWSIVPLFFIHATHSLKGNGPGIIVDAASQMGRGEKVKVEVRCRKARILARPKVVTFRRRCLINREKDFT